MITIHLPESGPLYDAVWFARKVDESVPRCAVRLLAERLLPRPPVPAAPLLSWVEVVDHA